MAPYRLLSNCSNIGGCMRSYSRFNKSLAKKYEEWMVALHYARHTKRIHRRSIRLFIEFLGNKSISAVTHVEVRQFMIRISEEGASLSAVYRHLAVLRLFYDFLNLGGVVSYVPPRLVRMRRPAKTPTRLLSELQVRQLIAATKTPRERALVEFLYGTGCRVSEASHLKVEDVDLAGRTARIAGKFGKVRMVLLTESAIQALRAYLGNRQTGYVFQPERNVQKGCLSRTGGYWVASWTDYGAQGPKYPRIKKTLGRVDRVSYEDARTWFNDLMQRVNLLHPLINRPLSNVSMEHALERIGERIGLKRVGPHMLRRSFATHLYENGANIEVIQALLGHTYLQSTMLYTRLSAGRLSNTFHSCHPLEKADGHASQ